MKKKNAQNYALLNFILYILLLIITPFLLLQNYLQSFIGMLSKAEFTIWEFDIPYILVVALILAFFLIIRNYKYLTLFRIISLITTLILVFIGQKLTDYYFNHKFYELQFNWHYFAYGIFAYITYRFYKTKNFTDAKIILYTFLTAICISTLDEIIQIYISSRIFDIGDIGKDSWGSVIGLVFIYFVIQPGKIAQDSRRLRQKKIKDYLKSPLSLLFLEFIFTLIFIFFASLLTEEVYLKYAVLVSICLFSIFFILFHFSQKRVFGKVIIIAVILVILLQGFFFIKYFKLGIVKNSYGLTIYKGIPLPFLDIMIYENGLFRFVDKKHSFNKRDINTICHHTSDILLIGSGAGGEGGKGFPENITTQFIFNLVKFEPLQVIILKTPQACKKFNQLKKEGYNVLFIIHNTR